MSPGNLSLYVCGINHKTSSLEQREPLQIGRNDIARANAIFGDLPGVMESLILSTCNRIEFYFAAGNLNEPLDLIKSFYNKFNNLDINDKLPLFYARKNKHAAAHLLNVASGLDSMVLGENQIMGQIKEAYSSACAVKTAGKVIHRLFHQAFRVGKQVRTDTEMGKGACSVSSAAVELLRAKINGLTKPSVLFIGINQMIALAANGISQLGYGSLHFANRTASKAIEFAGRYDAAGYGLESLPELLKQADIVISCTSAPEPVITNKIINNIFVDKNKRKLIIIDLAIPRDVEPAKDAYSNIELYDLEDIKIFVEKNRQTRELAIPQAQEIIDRKLSEFNYWFQHIRYEPLYNGLGDTFENIRQEELAAIIAKLPPEMRGELEGATKNMVEKLLRLKIRTSE